MSNNIDFKKMWNSQETPAPNLQALQEKINAYKKKTLKSRFFAGAAFVSTSVFIFSIWYFMQPELLSTKIGIVLVAVAMLLFNLAYNWSFMGGKDDFELDVNQHLQQLLDLKKKQQFVQTTAISLYFILLSLGIGLYMFEYAAKMSLLLAGLAYVAVTIWIVFNWFYLRPPNHQKANPKAR